MPPKGKAEPEPEPEAEAPEEPQEGHGTFVFPDGSKYEGSWLMQDGRKVRHGRGVFISGGADGNVYDGEWLDDKMHGRGTFRFASNAKYEGEFENNVYAGFGLYTFPDGSCYEGPFVDSQMHGTGTFTDAQGIPWRGQFYNGTGPGLPGSATVVAT